jgi:hypothetical protein
MNEFTPGPWKAEESNVIAPDGLVVAMVDGSFGSEIEANARLIAVAPDLLDIIEEFLIIMDAGYGFPDREKLVSLYGKAKKVYAKTDGYYRPRPENR